MKQLTELLSFLEENLSVEQNQKNIDKMKKCMNFEPIDTPCIAIATAQKQFPGLPYKETFSNMEAMLYNELLQIVSDIGINSCRTYCVRANYGVGTLPSLFGVNSVLVGIHNMPWVEPVRDIEEMKKIVSKGVPSLVNGFGQKILDTYEFYAETLASYPVCSQVIKLYHPDLQGPFDAAHVMFGSEIFLAMYDEPAFIHALLHLVTETYIAFMRRIKPYLNEEVGDNFSTHWNSLVKGNILVRNDATVNISKDMYQEFAAPYDKKLYDTFDTAGIHYCGHIQAWTDEMTCNGTCDSINFGRLPKADYGLDFVTRYFQTGHRTSIIDLIVTQEELQEIINAGYTTGITFKVNFGWERESAQQFMKQFR